MVKRKKTVLVIEDEAEVRRFVRRVLELEGYNAIEAGDGEAGLRFIRSENISLVLLDLRLPGQNGWEVLKQLKGDPGLSAIPVIVFTASVATLQSKQALAMGAADYLVKPLSAVTLRDAIARSQPKRGRRKHVT
jgi:adenylate cyclase